MKAIAFKRKINITFDFKISHPNPFLFGDLYRCRMLTCGEYLILKGSAFVLENYFIFVFKICKINMHSLVSLRKHTNNWNTSM